MKEIVLPAEKWDDYAQLNSCMALSQQEGDKVVSVKTFEYDGYLHMVHAALYSTYCADRSSTLYAYRLLPETLLEGDRTRYYDEESIKAGLRKRGDLSGLIVSAHRERLVCAFPVHFIKGLPSETCRLPLAEAIEFESQGNSVGWRAGMFRKITPSWLKLAGHPVARYEDGNGNCRHVLLWRHNGGIQEMAVSSSHPFTPPEEHEFNSCISPDAQFALF